MEKQQYLKGILIMIFSTLCFSVMAGLIRYVPNVDSYKTSLFRFAIGLALLGTAALVNKIQLNFKDARILLMRGFFGGIAVFLFYLSINKIGLARGSVINYSYPIFATIGSIFMLKEKVSFQKWLLILTALFGIYLISTAREQNVSGIGIYEILAVIGAICSGIAVVAVKKLQDTDSAYAIYFAQCAIGFWMVVIPANLVPCEVSITGGIVLLLIGITAAIGQVAISYGYKYLSVSTGSIIALLTPIFNIISGILIFGEHVGVQGIIGIITVILPCVLLLPAKNNASKN